jgi:DNA-nicking Smr family endonuclease
MSRRRLSDDERALWRGFARGVAPLRRAATAALGGAPDQAVGQAPPQTVARKQHAQAKQPPALAQFDHRLRQRVTRGQAAIDVRLDLHGMTQQRAHAALLHFLKDAQAHNAKLALVVTGKGGGSAALAASERGVLRRQVPLWLALPEFRRFVVSFEQAHAGHGGEGALYLHLRRRAR